MIGFFMLIPVFMLLAGIYFGGLVGTRTRNHEPFKPTAEDRLLLRVREDYAHDRITLDELEARTTRILVSSRSEQFDALRPPPPPPPPCADVVLSSIGGVLGTFCECGHPPHRHYEGGCNDCDHLRSGKPGEVTADGHDWRTGDLYEPHPGSSTALAVRIPGDAPRTSQFPRPQMEERR